ncbi:MAG: heterodisulfide reductase-related iron-sulfur binding cluster, partial [Gemmatimonadota bacterium]|nr:heterodisulfide reductase-related iron-sulfur binding cluster [Gemmatimonadota bacterium]
LMKGLDAGRLSRDDAAVATHLDQCLGCRACETACPSGVPYGQLLEETRATLAEARPLPLIARAVLFVFARPALSRLAFALARLTRESGVSGLLAKLPGRIGIGMANLEATRRDAPTAAHGARSAAAHATPVARASIAARPAVKRPPVVVLTGCVMEGLLAPVNRATERVLAFNGYQLRPAAAQVCCGALHAHAGARATARELARRNIAAFEASGADFFAVNSAGCGASMKEYGHLLADDAGWKDRAEAFSRSVRDVSELLAEAGPVPAELPGGGRVAVDFPCHLQHGQRLNDPPARLMRAMRGIEATELPDATQCCGSAGLYSLSNPALSQQILAPKLTGIAASNADVVATGNPGCMMHIGAGLVRSGSRVQTRHPVELLDAAYAAASRAGTVQ